MTKCLFQRRIILFRNIVPRNAGRNPMELQRKINAVLQRHNYREWHRCDMTLLSGERQVSNNITSIRRDHTSRYYWANSFIRKGDCVLDACCGIGYGSFIIATTNLPKLIVSFDCDKETIKYAKNWYQLPNIEYQCCDAEEMLFKESTFNKIVCFEGIEHVEDPLSLLINFNIALKNDGLLLLSTPNGRVLPHDSVKFPEHKLHYTPELLGEHLDIAGFKIDKWLSQAHKMSVVMDNNLDGRFMLCVASKL